MVKFWSSLNFYPRSPRGERLVDRLHHGTQVSRFLSTLPARGATVEISGYGLIFNISIHAPREGSDI